MSRVAEDSQTKNNIPVLSVLNLIIWFVLEGHRNWIDGTAFQPKEFPVGSRINSVHLIRFVVDRCSVGQWFKMIWQWVLWFMCPKSDVLTSQVWTHTIPAPFHVFMPTSASGFTMFHPLTLQCFGPHPCSQEAVPISITISVLHFVTRSKGVLPGNHSWNSNWHHSIYHFNWSRFGLQNLTSGDSMCGNRCLILHIGSEVSKNRISLCGCQRHWRTPKPIVSTK